MLMLTYADVCTLLTSLRYLKALLIQHTDPILIIRFDPRWSTWMMLMLTYADVCCHTDPLMIIRRDPRWSTWMKLKLKFLTSAPQKETDFLFEHTVTRNRDSKTVKSEQTQLHQLDHEDGGWSEDANGIQAIHPQSPLAITLDIRYCSTFSSL